MLLWNFIISYCSSILTFFGEAFDLLDVFPSTCECVTLIFSLNGQKAARAFREISKMYF